MFTFERSAHALISVLLLGTTVTALASSTVRATAPPMSPAAVEAATAAAPSGENMPVGDLPGWRQIFTDDFTTDVPLGDFPTAVSSKWSAYPSPWKDTSGYGRYTPEKVVSISGGILNKNIHTENGVPMVAAIEPKLSGAVTYARYAVRFRFDEIAGYKVAWLLWPDSNNSQRDGEIDFPEMNLDSDEVWAFNHRTDSTGAEDQAWFKNSLDPGEWHTAVIEWSPNLVLFRLDGVEIGRTSVRVSTTAMHWVLQTETEVHLTAPPAASVSGNVQIDWAAVWAYDTSTADTTPPVTAISSPITGSTVSKATTVSATASDNKGVVGVQFQLDGMRLGAELTEPTGPYATTWNTELSTAGTHILTVVARDDAGNMTTSVPVTVTVANIADTTHPTATYIPKSDTTIFPLGANLFATFSEAVTGVNGNSFSLKNAVTGEAIPATVNYTVDANSSKASLVPFNDLSTDTKYTATLTSAINDTSGNSMVTSSWSFVTGPRPTALPTSPLPNATNVSRTTNITAIASETLTRVGNTTFLLKSSSGAAISGEVTFNTSTKVATLNPSVTLAASTKYTVSMTSNIKDVVGNPLLPLTWSFTTATDGTVDSTPPTVAVSPDANATVFPVGSSLYPVFSESVTGVNGSSFSLQNLATGAAIPATVTATASTAKLNPTASLTTDTWYTATLTSAINDVAGNALAPTSWSFLTGPRPTAVPTSPASNATNVSLTTNITATASETLTKVGNTTFLLKSSSGTSISGDVTFNTSTKLATLDPGVTLAANTKYTASMTSNIKDVAGNPLVPLTWSFTTAVDGSTDSIPPTVILSPSADATVFPVGSSLYPVFSESVTGVNGSSFSLKDTTTGATIPATVTATASTAKLNPTASLTADTQYTATLTSAITDVAGNALASKSWSFLTGPRPTAVATSPLPNATNVSRTTNITATASETLTKVGNTTFLLKSSSGTSISGDVTFNASTKLATLDPGVTLAANTKYTASMTSNIKDVVGNPLVPLTWSFTTGS